MEDSFVHKGFTVSMNAVRNDTDSERARFDVAVTIEDISTGQFLLNETRLVEALDKEQMTAERALNHCAREARNLIDGGRKP
ncbi:hypothetical protein [Caballeronia mineralivorans]|jgi:hypothetical protein|uniref:hypothetical protein n=1 Tax=Caballeronia mineralivorans TaxID=2010198 RepID=UPI0023F139FE|nr:hypothetical protein [Caballeronia mineralivorans]MDB5780476.1 hypothetical protein [Caballeronia mineralivorans]MEA3102529.1 hypothetical protein [Caballeronia mineralivorans]